MPPLSNRAKKFIEAGKNPPSWLRAIYRERGEQHSRWRKDGVPFPVGQKQIYLPNFIVTLLRTPHLSPRWAQFQVPLTFNKLDIRDYLFHAYNVRVFNVRSFIVPQPIMRRSYNDPDWIPGKKTYFRPQPVKKMMVELEKPFVWPEPPSERDINEKWEKTRFDSSALEATGVAFDEKENEKRMVKEQKLREYSLRQKAERLLKGVEKWNDVDSSIFAGAPGAGHTSLPVR